MQTIRTITWLCALVALAAVTASAHHSWTAEYDVNKPITVTGTVSKMEWTNPHTHIYVDVKDAQGAVITWNFEMASTPALERGGWTRRSLPVGAQVTIGGFAAREFPTRAVANSVVTADGKKLFAGAPGN